MVLMEDVESEEILSKKKSLYFKYINIKEGIFES